MLFKKKKKQLEKIIEEKKITQMDKPNICLFDFDDEVYKKLTIDGYKINKATFGNEISVPNDRPRQEKLCLLNHSYPKNIHEFDIFAFSNLENTPIPYKSEDNTQSNGKEFKTYYLLSKYPQRIFDPRPFSAHLLGEEIKSRVGNKIIIIAFAKKKIEIDYQIAEMSTAGYSEGRELKYNSYEYCSLMPFLENKVGQEIMVITKNEGLNRLLSEHLKETRYEVVFHHPNIWDEQLRKSIPDPEFIPIMKNIDNDIVSFIRIYKQTLLLVLPEITDKYKILFCLLQEILPEIIPDLFPFYTAFKWKEQEPYWLPNHKELLKEKEKIEKDYKTAISLINNKIEDNISTNKFLHELITETGEILVLSVKKYLEWLGFLNVKIMDNEKKNIREEDIQIENENGLLVIEIKGIGGTSTDGDCSQIMKIVNRRQKERNAFNVHGLYIVNNQRYLPPFSRKTPPFSAEQISDAVNDERGLLTTWDLFNAFPLIQNGTITKENARNILFKKGLISFCKCFGNYLGKAKEIYKEGFVIIVNISNTIINNGDKLIAEKEGSIVKCVIKNIQISSENVITASNGEIGIEVSERISKNSEIYILKK